ncbi:hypothetical protein TNCV_145221 [Trichonephila clavipes]|nr:hypothetical protein TNCV_145221 [Trichonephila clavipes]
MQKIGSGHERPCRMIIRHVKNPLKCPLGLAAKILKNNSQVQFCIVRAQVPSSEEDTEHRNYLRQLLPPTKRCRSKK